MKVLGPAVAESRSKVLGRALVAGCFDGWGITPVNTGSSAFGQRAAGQAGAWPPSIRKLDLQ